MTTIEKAEVHENSISLLLLDKQGNELYLRIPCATRADRADIEDRLLSAGVKVKHV
ncbi:hypothetical protein [Hymenobacter siberiensis]|uniref:hypothetical protein n=1 Tax=Hymenobacter siberiensis TaxID=2848396 RepID=UPI001C1DE62D|nr:hypothetical protein [Hymenobacter siberiensis]